MSQRPLAQSTPPFAFPALVSDLALGRARRTQPGGPSPLVDTHPSDPTAVVVSGLFLDAVEAPLADLTVMELDAGHGRCGPLLARRGVGTVIAVDPTPRPDHASYAERIAGELTALDAEGRARLERHRFDGLVSAGGLGVEGIPPSDFVEALDQVVRGGWLCVAFEAAVLGPSDTSGFGALVRALCVRGVIEVETSTSFDRCVCGAPRALVALLARKGRAIYDA